ncbi:MAG: mechanosensitive ion channel domain-containing protein [Pseudomonadota bacterium]
MDETVAEAGDGVGYLQALVIEYGLNVVVAALILIVGFWAAGRVGAFVTRRMKAAPRVDQTLASFVGSLARYALLAVVIIAVLNRFGVETTSLVALIGAAGLAIGLALQGTLSNLAAGVMLILFRPFKNGDYVEAAGVAGTVKEISLFVTELATVDNVQIIVPNGKVWGDTIVNYSAHEERRVDLVFGVGYGVNLKTAEEAIRAEIAADPRIRSTPAEPFVAVTNLGDSSVDFTVRVWCAASDYWGLKFDLTRKVKERFDAAGVDIPFPTTTIVQTSAA